jgi:hypothetical protein
MRKREAFRTITWAAGTLLIAFLLMPSHTFPRGKDYSLLVESLKDPLKDEAPLYAFNTFEEDFDSGGHQVDLRFLNDHPTLVQNIRKDLGGGEIAWRLENSRHRLLFVPEKREKFASLYKDYCNDVIDYILRETELDNPYVKIETLLKERPRLSEKGVTVFLVHNLAEEVVGTYIFSNPIQKSLMIELSRKTFLGEGGSYSTNIRLRENGEPEFTWNRFTIWQTTAKNPFAVLCVPVEETLHIALREHTHRAILDQITPETLLDTDKLNAIVQDWMMVEEALVGGVTYALLPDFLKRYAMNLSDSLIEDDLESRGKFKQYRHLKRAIAVIGSVGHEKAIKMYVDHPENFKKSLI